MNAVLFPPVAVCCLVLGYFGAASLRGEVNVSEKPAAFPATQSAVKIEAAEDAEAAFRACFAREAPRQSAFGHARHYKADDVANNILAACSVEHRRFVKSVGEERADKVVMRTRAEWGYREAMQTLDNIISGR